MPTPRTQTARPLPETTERIANNIGALRKSRGLTQAQLAERTGISRDHLANYELGRTHLTDDVIIRLANALRVSADTLLGIKDNGQAEQLSSVRLVRRMQKIAELPQSEQKAILKTIDNFLKGAAKPVDSST